MTQYSIGLIEHEGVLMTRKQLETIGGLNAYIENLEFEADGYGPRDAQWIVFTGDGQDGPCGGWVKSDGTVSWMVEA